VTPNGDTLDEAALRALPAHARLLLWPSDAAEPQRVLLCDLIEAHDLADAAAGAGAGAPAVAPDAQGYISARPQFSFFESLGCNDDAVLARFTAAHETRPLPQLLPRHAACHRTQQLLLDSRRRRLLLLLLRRRRA
jgi:hypothetical protein